MVNLNVNHEEHVLRALADTGASSSIILASYTSKDSKKQNIEKETRPERHLQILPQQKNTMLKKVKCYEPCDYF